MKHVWLRMSRVAVQSEQEQCRAEGREMHTVEQWFDQVLSTDLENRRNWQAANNLLDQTIQLPLASDLKYYEPSDLKQIKEARPWDSPPELPPLNKADIQRLTDKVNGAWTGRCAGCLLGLPFEGWTRQRIWGLLQETEQFPLSKYVRFAPMKGDAALLARYEIDAQDPDHPFVDLLPAGGMPEDDELNYTVMNLAILRRYGPNFTSLDIAEFWLENLPIMHTQGAECLAYRNFCLQIPPPESATYRNPYREWNGAAIRGDYWGYVAAGDPERAADLAWRDACVSHVRNGIYASMWIAAMTAAAFVTDDIPTILRVGLAQIPQDCRLAEGVNHVIAWHEAGTEYDAVVQRLHERWSENQPWMSRHAVSNAQVVALALLYGGGEFADSICKAVQAGFETDSNGATVGSILGILHGRQAIPKPWVEPLHDTLHTGIENLQSVAIPHLVQATIQGMVAVLGRGT
jgi:ADP-ribosylglycohydrolase